MKKITSILIVFLLFFDSCGYIFVYIELSNYFKKEASQRIIEFIPSNKIDIIKIHKSEISKINSPIRFIKNNEIIFKGDLYDILKEVSKEDSVYYYCFKDVNENILEKAFALYIEKNTQENSRNRPIINILNNIIKFGMFPLSSNDYNYHLSFNFLIQNIYFLPQYFLDIPTPPPKFNS